jgi:hypothetical protein
MASGAFIAKITRIDAVAFGHQLYPVGGIHLAAVRRFAAAVPDREDLLVEDEPNQALLVQDALKGDNGFTMLPVVRSGEEAIAYLSGQGKCCDRANHPFPFLMLFELKMPDIGGVRVLAANPTGSE